MTLIRKGIRAASLFLLASILPFGALGQTIVWTDENGGRIQRKDTGGGPVTTITQFPSPESASLIHYDPIGAKLYYLLYYEVAPGSGSLIFERSNVDGSASETIPTPSVGNFAINVEARQLYWIESLTTLRRATLDGSAIGSHAFTIGAVNVLEAIGNDLYFMTSGGTKAVWHADADGSNEHLLHNAGVPNDLAFDPVDRKLYFSTGGGIYRINLDGTGFEPVVNLPAWGQNPDLPEQIEIDHVGRKLYWLDGTAKLIQRSNLNGSNVEDFVTASQAGNPDLILKGLTIIHPPSIPAMSAGGLIACCLALIFAGSFIALRRATRQNE